MIRVSIELVPHGVEKAKNSIGTLEIWNTRKSNKDGKVYGYSYGGKSFPALESIEYEGEITRQPHSGTALKLVEEVLRDIFE